MDGQIKQRSSKRGIAGPPTQQMDHMKSSSFIFNDENNALI